MDRSSSLLLSEKNDFNTLKFKVQFSSVVNILYLPFQHMAMQQVKQINFKSTSGPGDHFEVTVWVTAGTILKLNFNWLGNCFICAKFADQGASITKCLQNVYIASVSSMRAFNSTQKQAAKLNQNWREMGRKRKLLAIFLVYRPNMTRTAHFIWNLHNIYCWRIRTSRFCQLSPRRQVAPGGRGRAGRSWWKPSLRRWSRGSSCESSGTAGRIPDLQKHVNVEWKKKKKGRREKRCTE